MAIALTQHSIRSDFSWKSLALSIKTVILVKACPRREKEVSFPLEKGGGRRSLTGDLMEFWGY